MCTVNIDFSQVRTVKFISMELGTEVTIYCVYNSRLVKLKCEKNGNVNDDEVATECDETQLDCIYNSELGLLQNFWPAGKMSLQS